jgi:hypothetical protein
MGTHTNKYLCILCLSFLAATLSTEAPAAEQYRMVRSAGNVCSVAAKFLNNSYKSPANKQLGIEIYYGDPIDGDDSGVVLPSGLTAFPIGYFDFDNDGITDRVFSSEEAGRYISGTILFVAFGDGKEVPAPKKKLSVTDVKIFPCQFDPTVANSSSCPMVSQGADEAGITVNLGSGPQVFFRGRYTVINPIRHKNRTYLVLRGNSTVTEPYAGVIETLGDTSYRATCLLRRRSK